MQRITDTMLLNVLRRIISITKSPNWPQPGSYNIDYQYGGVQLVQMCISGGERNVLSGGHIPKRELQERMHAYLAGYQDCINNT